MEEDRYNLWGSSISKRKQEDREDKMISRNESLAAVRALL